MKIPLIVILIATVLSCKEHQERNTSESYNIVPKPLEIEIGEGKFVLQHKATIDFPEALENEAQYLMESVEGLNRQIISFTRTTNVKADITLNIDTSITNDEGYLLEVGHEKIKITGKTAAGVFYGVQSLLQLVELPIDGETYRDVTIPAVTIKDAPRYKYRGMHLDVARHFFDIEFVKRYIDLIAMHKMNTFHWHLTEDQGWRIEIKKYPKLTEVGAYRNGTIIGHYPGEGNDNTKYGGFYTQDDIREVLAHATKRHVTVIPEIELPGHSQAAIASYPFLSCYPEERTEVPNGMISEKSKDQQQASEPKIVQESWGVYNDVYCAGKEETFEFLENVLDEVTELFPSQYIHIGGDECPKENWKRCPSCQERIKKEGLEGEHGLQSYFVQRVEKYLNNKGKQIIGWDEILEGGIAPNATVMSWRGTKGGIEAAQQGHDVIMTPTSYCYFDYYQSKDTQNEPLAIGGYLPVEQVYSFEPTEGLNSDEEKHILGAQGNVWTEYMTTTGSVEYMVLPRMAAMSEVAWTAKNQRDYEDFEKRMMKFKSIYEAKGYNYATHLFEESVDNILNE
ncbi:beta-N-acetylhexosaminidase [Allomuricauda sp. M10]|uniref:beta-N-acetylhexosaminidase n=1 Tax=Allomuricauda sp. M10 TaxID=2683292 RepID=UPI001D192CB2|nr:beta-N-acetylhexosaminidase [Muricauda sp. M10]